MGVDTIGDGVLVWLVVVLGFGWYCIFHLIILTALSLMISHRVITPVGIGSGTGFLRSKAIVMMRGSAHRMNRNMALDGLISILIALLL